MSNAAPKPDSSEIHKALRLLFRQGDVAEIRVPKAGSYGTISGYFDNSEAVLHSALSVDGKGNGSYVTLNPVDRALLARSANKLKNHALLATSDLDIVHRRWLLIDLDPNRPAGISSTDEQHQAALRRARNVACELADDGWPEPVITDSGNGAHLLYRVDLPNDQQSTDLIARLLTAFSNRYSDQDIAVDRTVYNAARIIKLYGKVARKGDNTPDDMEADSIGGRVNLITKRAPATRHLGLTLGSGFNSLAKDDLKDYSATYGQRVFDGKLGFIGSGNFYQNNRGSQDLERYSLPRLLPVLTFEIMY